MYLTIETMIGGIMFFLGVYAVISMKRAAEQFSSAQPIRDDRIAQNPVQRLRSFLPLVTGVLVGIIVLPHLPASYMSSAFLAFNIGIAFAVLSLILQKIRMSSL